jgi:hypothetical protein
MRIEVAEKSQGAPRAFFSGSVRGVPEKGKSLLFLKKKQQKDFWLLAGGVVCFSKMSTVSGT